MLKYFQFFLLFLILFPLCVFGGSKIMMSPAKFDVDSNKPLKAGGEYKLSPDFYIYNGLPELTTYKIMVECFEGQKEICPPAEHFVFNPQTFS